MQLSPGTSVNEVLDKVLNMENSKQFLRVFSIASSLFSMAAAMTFGYRRKMNRMMSYPALGCYFIYTFSSILYRSLCLQICILTLGPGNFMYFYLLLGTHIFGSIIIDNIISCNFDCKSYTGDKKFYYSKEKSQSGCFLVIAVSFYSNEIKVSGALSSKIKQMVLSIV